MPDFTAAVTVLAIVFYFYTSLRVGTAREKYAIAAPATSGHPEFERIYRVQMNTLEWMPIFLPALWLFAFYVSDPAAAAIGLVWIAGRILYMVRYIEAAAKRSTGFAVQATAAGALVIGGSAGVIWRMIHHL